MKSYGSFSFPHFPSTSYMYSPHHESPVPALADTSSRVKGTVQVQSSWYEMEKECVMKKEGGLDLLMK